MAQKTQQVLSLLWVQAQTQQSKPLKNLQKTDIKLVLSKLDYTDHSLLAVLLNSFHKPHQLSQFLIEQKNVAQPMNHLPKMLSLPFQMLAELVFVFLAEDMVCLAKSLHTHMLFLFMKTLFQLVQKITSLLVLLTM